jgi:hypothetical protein
MADFEISVGINATATKAGAAEVKAEMAGIRAETGKMSSAASQDWKNIAQQARGLAAAIAASKAPLKNIVADYKDSIAALEHALVSSSSSVEQYRQRWNKLPTSVQDAITMFRKARAGLDEVDEANKKTTNSSGKLVQGFLQLEKAGGQTGRRLSLLEQGLANIGGAGVAGIAVIGILAVAAAIAVLVIAAVKLYEGIVSLAKGFADYVTGVRQMKEDTGLATDTVIGLNHELEAQGRSIGDLNGVFSNFRKLIGEAAAGSEDARAKLKQFGIDGSKAMYDVDGAFRTALKAIADAPTEMDKAKLAFAAFGEDGVTKLLPVLRDAHGDIDTFIKKAKALGLQLGGDNVQQAEAFTRASADLSSAWTGVKNALGSQFLELVARQMQNLTNFVVDNQTQFQHWGALAANAVQNVLDKFNSLANFVKENPWILYLDPGTAAAVSTGRALRSMAENTPISGGGVVYAQGDQSSRAPWMADPVAMAAKLGYKPPKAPKLTDEQKQVNDLQGIIDDLNRQIGSYGDKTQVAVIKNQLLSMGVKDLTSGYAAQALALAGVIDKMDRKHEADQRASEDRKRVKDSYDAATKGIDDQGFSQVLDLGGQERQLQRQLELHRELTDVEKQEAANILEIQQKTREWEQAGIDPKLVLVLQEALRTQQATTMEIVTQIQKDHEKLKAEQDALDLAQRNKDLQADLTDTLHDLNVQLGLSAEYSEHDRIQKLLQTEAYKNLTPEVKALRMAQADEVDQAREAVKAHEEMKQKYDETVGTIRDSLMTLSEQGFGGLFRSIKQRFTEFLADMIAQWIASKFFKTFYQGGNTQTAQANGQGGGGILGAITQGIFGGQGNAAGGGSGGGIFSGSNGGGIFHFGGSGSGAGYNANFDPLLGYDPRQDSTIGGGSRSGGFFGGLGMSKNIFTGKDMSKNMQMVSGIGALVAMAGGMIHNRFGSILQGAGTGMMFGAMFGPLGAAIGAGVGALVGLISSIFGGNKQRKQDEATRNQAMLDADSQLKQFDQIISDVRTLKMDPRRESPRARRWVLRSATQYHADVANSLKDKKTRNIALADVSRIDAIISQKMKELEGCRRRGDGGE